LGEADLQLGSGVLSQSRRLWVASGVKGEKEEGLGAGTLRDGTGSYLECGRWTDTGLHDGFLAKVNSPARFPLACSLTFKQDWVKNFRDP
jgi:hypothetical protein